MRVRTLVGGIALLGLGAFLLRKKKEKEPPPIASFPKPTEPKEPTSSPSPPPDAQPVPSDPSVEWAETTSQRQGIADIAENEIGSKQKAKYWSKVLDGKKQPSHSWCGAFALWVLRTAGVTDWTYDPNGSWFLQLNTTAKPEPGDIAWFDDTRHVGVVVKTSTDGRYVRLVDGAGTGGAVSTRTIPTSKATSYLSIGSLLGQKTSEPPKSPAMPGGWKRMAQADVTPAMVSFAQQALKAAGSPGKLQTTTIDGKELAAWTEWHYDDQRGYHKGITLLERSA